VSDWCFRYEGPPAGLREAIEKHEKVLPAMPDLVRALIEVQIASDEGAAECVVMATGQIDEPAERETRERQLAAELECSVQRGCGRVCQKETQDCTVNHEATAGTGPRVVRRECIVHVITR
jgi:hypothetical protein